MRRYIYEFSEWPNFHWQNSPALVVGLAAIDALQKEILAKLALLDSDDVRSISCQTISAEIIASSQIEGVALNRKSVRSSVAKRLGIGDLSFSDHAIEGIVDARFDVLRNDQTFISAERLFSWHAAHFPLGYSGLQKIRVAAWRETSMRVVSGPIGAEVEHYRAPEAENVPRYMEDFLQWLNASNEKVAIVKAAIAHLWFVLIHPFDDGNGRMARLISDAILNQDLPYHISAFSLSEEILKNKKQYYNLLDFICKREILDVTDWIEWYISIFKQTLNNIIYIFNLIIKRTKVWDKTRQYSLSDRQKKVLTKYLDNFIGKMTAQKYKRICKCSLEIAVKELNELYSYGLIDLDGSDH